MWIDNIEEYNRIPGAIRTGKDKVVLIEDLIMKVAMVEQIVLLKCRVDDIFESDVDINEPLEKWAVSGMLQGLTEVKHALKSGLYGYEEAYKH